MIGDALISDCGRYRYWLRRHPLYVPANTVAMKFS